MAAITIAYDTMCPLRNGVSFRDSAFGVSTAKNQMAPRANTPAPDTRICHPPSLKDIQTRIRPSTDQATLTHGPPSCTGTAVVRNTNAMTSALRLR